VSIELPWRVTRGTAAHLLVFQQLTPEPDYFLSMPAYKANLIAADGNAAVKVISDGVGVRIPRPLGFAWARLTLSPSSELEQPAEV
jgi:hypothetical protein